MGLAKEYSNLGFDPDQIRDNDPPETRETFERLIGSGHTREEARVMITIVLAAEVSEMMECEREFEKSGFVAALRRLPVLPEGLEDRRLESPPPEVAAP